MTRVWQARSHGKERRDLSQAGFVCVHCTTKGQGKALRQKESGFTIPHACPLVPLRKHSIFVNDKRWRQQL